MKTMKIIEALQQLKLIVKRMEKQTQQIGEYASYVSTEGTKFKDEAEQKKELEALVQSNLDLASHYLKIKTTLDFTNLKTEVHLNGKDYTIAELIILRRFLGEKILATHRALNNTSSLKALRSQATIDPTNPPRVVTLYSEKTKNATIDEWQTFIDDIDAKLEVVNAETSLL